VNVVAIVNIEAKKGKSREALDMIKSSQELCLSLDFCGGFEILQNQKDEHLFQFIERWASVKQHKEFLSALMNDANFVESLEVFTSGPNIEYFNLI